MTTSRSPRSHARPLGRGVARPTLADHLLDAGGMPPAGEVAWRVAESGPEDAAAVGACQKTALEPIGAVEAIRRAFVPTAGGDAVATQVVARFADAKSAWRAHQVLHAWQADCAERLDEARPAVGPLSAVRVRAGSGESYLARFGPRHAREGRATGLGILRLGRYLSVVEVITARDAYPAGFDPARAAVRRIARTFA